MAALGAIYHLEFNARISCHSIMMRGDDGCGAATDITFTSANRTMNGDQFMHSHVFIPSSISFILLGAVRRRVWCVHALHGVQSAFDIPCAMERALEEFQHVCIPMALILSATKMHCDASAAHWKYERNSVATIAMQILQTCAGQAVTCVASRVQLQCRLKAEHLKLIECILVGYCTACHFHNSSAHCTHTRNWGQRDKCCGIKRAPQSHLTNWNTRKQKEKLYEGGK